MGPATSAMRSGRIVHWTAWKSIACMSPTADPQHSLRRHNYKTQIQLQVPALGTVLSLAGPEASAVQPGSQVKAVLPRQAEQGRVWVATVCPHCEACLEMSLVPLCSALHSASQGGHWQKWLQAFL